MYVMPLAERYKGKVVMVVYDHKEDREVYDYVVITEASPGGIIVDAVLPAWDNVLEGPRYVKKMSNLRYGTRGGYIPCNAFRVIWPTPWTVEMVRDDEAPKPSPASDGDAEPTG